MRKDGAQPASHTNFRATFAGELRTAHAAPPFTPPPQTLPQHRSLWTLVLTEIHMFNTRQAFE